MDQLQKPENENKPRGFGWIWWVGLAELMVWNGSALLPLGTPTVNLPYGALLDQVKAGNVASVTIAGADISGTFKQPVTWPPATSTPAASGTPAAAPTAEGWDAEDALLLTPGFGQAGRCGLDQSAPTATLETRSPMPFAVASTPKPEPRTAAGKSSAASDFSSDA